MRQRRPGAFSVRTLPLATAPRRPYLVGSMLSELLVYLRLGFEHIADPRGYDHILFIVALTAVYAPVEWLRVVVLVTAFTIGHTITLILSTLDLVRIPSDLVELLIPVTIIATAALNASELWWSRGRGRAGEQGAPPLTPPSARLAKYMLALLFGLVHGLGFSNFLRAALGAEASLTIPLLAFNLGLEVGQVFIVVALMALTGIVTAGLRVPRPRWALLLSIAAAAVALRLVMERLPLQA